MTEKTRIGCYTDTMEAIEAVNKAVAATGNLKAVGGLTKDLNSDCKKMASPHWHAWIEA